MLSAAGLTWRRVERASKLVAGLAILWHEVWLVPHERPYILATALGLLGLTEMWRLDRARRDEDL